MLANIFTSAAQLLAGQLDGPDQVIGAVVAFMICGGIWSISWHRKQRAANKGGMSSGWFILLCCVGAAGFIAAAGYGFGLRASSAPEVKNLGDQAAIAKSPTASAEVEVTPKNVDVVDSARRTSAVLRPRKQEAIEVILPIIRDEWREIYEKYDYINGRSWASVWEGKTPAFIAEAQAFRGFVEGKEIELNLLMRGYQQYRDIFSIVQQPYGGEIRDSITGIIIATQKLATLTQTSAPQSLDIETVRFFLDKHTDRMTTVSNKAKQLRAEMQDKLIELQTELEK